MTVIATIAATACLSRPALVPQLFTINPPLERAAIPGRGPAIAVKQVSVAAPFDGVELVYRSGPYRLERDPYATLAAPPAALLSEAIRTELARAGFVRESADGEARPQDLRLDVEVRELSGDFARPDQPAGVLVVGFVVSPADGGSPLFRKVYARRMALPHRTAEAVVTAWNQELAETMRELERDLDKVLPRTASSRPPG
jgi:uncharacterized lipoprotein YmbA